METLSRRSDLDTAKGLGMLLVVVGHTQPPETIQTVIYSFHMPLFFFVSGILWRGQVKLKHSLRALWYPFILASVASWIFWLIKSAVHTSATENVPWWGPILATVWGGDIGGFFVHNRPLWFLPAMLSMLAIIWGLRLYLSATVTIWCIAFVGTLVTFAPAEYQFSAYPFSMSQGLVGGIFFAAGHLLTPTTKSRNQIVTLLALGIWICAAVYNGRVDLFSMNFGNPVLYIISGCAGSWSLIRICQSDIIKSNVIPILGKQSLLILCIHMPLLILIRAAFKAIQIPQYWWAISFVCIICTTRLAIAVDKDI